MTHTTGEGALQRILESQRRAFLAEGPVSWQTRVDRLERAITLVRSHDQRLVEAMSADCRRPRTP